MAQRRAASLWDLPAAASAPPAGSPPQLVGAWAEVSRAIDGSGLPPRVLVHAIVRSDFRGVLEVVLRDGDEVVQRVTGPVASVVGDAAFIADVRTFKVYVEDAHQIVELRIDAWRWSLGEVAALPVGGL